MFRRTWPRPCNSNKNIVIIQNQSSRVFMSFSIWLWAANGWRCGFCIIAICSFLLYAISVFKRFYQFMNKAQKVNKTMFYRWGSFAYYTRSSIKINEVHIYYFFSINLWWITCHMGGHATALGFLFDKNSCNNELVDFNKNLL